MAMPGARPAIRAAEQGEDRMIKKMDTESARKKTPYMERQGLIEDDDEKGVEKMADIIDIEEARKKRAQQTEAAPGVLKRKKSI